MGSEKISVLFDELKTALSAALRRYEVGISFGEWQQYLQRNQITEPATHGKKSHAGRPEKKSWSRLAPIIAGFMMTLEKRPDESRDHDYIAQRIHEIATKDSISDLPVVATLRDTISKAFTKADEFSREGRPARAVPSKSPI